MIPWRTLIRSKAKWLVRDGDTHIYDEIYNRKYFVFGFKIFERAFEIEHDIKKIDKSKKSSGF